MDGAEDGRTEVELGDGLVGRPLLEPLNGARIFARDPSGPHVLAEDGLVRHTGHVGVVSDFRQHRSHVVFSARNNWHRYFFVPLHISYRIEYIKYGTDTVTIVIKTTCDRYHSPNLSDPILQHSPPFYEEASPVKDFNKTSMYGTLNAHGSNTIFVQIIFWGSLNFSSYSPLKILGGTGAVMSNQSSYMTPRPDVGF